MPWWAAGATVLGSGIGALSQKDAPKPRPYQEADAAFRVNNPNMYTPTGSMEWVANNNGTPNDRSDDTYTGVQKYSPEMQGLLDAMLGTAGAAPSQFQSRMPIGVRERMKDVFGSPVPTGRSQYTPPEYAFGFDGGVAQPNDKEVDTGNAMVGLEVAPGMTNQELVAQAFQTGAISRDDYKWMQQLMNSDDPFSGGQSTAWSSTPLEELIANLEGLTAKNRHRLESLFYAIPRD